RSGPPDSPDQWEHMGNLFSVRPTVKLSFPATYPCKRLRGSVGQHRGPGVTAQTGWIDRPAPGTSNIHLGRPRQLPQVSVVLAYGRDLKGFHLYCFSLYSFLSRVSSVGVWRVQKYSDPEKGNSLVSNFILFCRNKSTGIWFWFLISQRRSEERRVGKG